MLLSLWRRALVPFKEFGLCAGTLYVLDWGLRTISARMALHVYELMEQPIDGRPLLPARLAQNLEFVEIGSGHPAIAHMPALPAIKASRFAQGARCLGVYRRGVLLGYIWWCRTRYEEDAVRCTFQLQPSDSSVFDFDLYVLPEHRLGIAFMAIWHGANQWWYAMGIRHSFSRVTLFNLPSRRAHARLGGRRVGLAIVLQMWDWEAMISTARPYVGLSWRSGQRMILKLLPASRT